MWYKHIREFIVGIPWLLLIPLTLFLGLAPFDPQPHLLEKLIMLLEGRLNVPLDVIDLLFHSSPLILLMFKLIISRKNN